MSEENKKESLFEKYADYQFIKFIIILIILIGTIAYAVIKNLIE